MREKPAGSLRITSVEHASETILAPAVARLLGDYPDIRVEIINDYSLIDIVAERYDAGVRLGEQVAKDMIALRIGSDFLLKSNNQKSVIVADNFPEENLPAGFMWQRESQATKDQLNTAAGAISGCEVAIAHTGTIILRGARQLTLLPDRFLCIVREHQIVDTVPEAIARLEQYKTRAAHLRLRPVRNGRHRNDAHPRRPRSALSRCDCGQKLSRC